jgi:hypothetical protein
MGGWGAVGLGASEGAGDATGDMRAREAAGGSDAATHVVYRQGRGWHQRGGVGSLGTARSVHC